ncbi:HD domain-containing protein [Candidatus Tisiphia endosymbiont of Melanophora roralis]|uniref:HD domain-containing protein n=1 Tax=Candidatus Tisiphia endosymbiont of Melanophora roralis TaxID=3066261 RepID=UPI001E7B1FEF|nr:MAG: HD domain-containing protein [Rickettsia endosymbiont of Cimex lectularius]
MEEKEINYWDNSKYAPCQYATRLLDKLRKMNEEVNRPIDIDEVRKAIYYAKKYHGSQMRQSGEPYYSHPLEVAYMISDYLFRTDIIVTSILHDTIEDTELTEKMIAYIFGEQVASQVEDLSRNKPHGKISSAEMMESLYRQKKYDTLIIKIFDRLHNIETLEAKSPEKAKKIIEETLKYSLILCEVVELPWLCDILYEKCHKHNIRLGVIKNNADIFTKLSQVIASPFSQNKTLL